MKPLVEKLKERDSKCRFSEKGNSPGAISRKIVEKGSQVWQQGTTSGALFSVSGVYPTAYSTLVVCSAKYLLQYTQFCLPTTILHFVLTEFLVMNNRTHSS